MLQKDLLFEFNHLADAYKNYRGAQAWLNKYLIMWNCLYGNLKGLVARRVADWAGRRVGLDETGFEGWGRAAAAC